MDMQTRLQVVFHQHYQNKVTMDRVLRAEIVAEVRRSMTEILEVANEKWLTGEELCKQFQMFSPGWLKAYGERMPRQRAEVQDGGTKASRWAYPMHKIARMINDGTIKDL
jgi:hypothetical protein